MKARIIFPLHIYSEGELEDLKAGFEKEANPSGVALIAAEQAIRQQEYALRMKPRKRKPHINAA